MNATEILGRAINNLTAAAQQSGSTNVARIIGAMEPAFIAAGKRAPHPSEHKNILVIRLDDIGDNVLNSGFLRELRGGFPTATITLVVNTVVKNMVELCPYVDNVFAIDTRVGQAIDETFITAREFCERKLWQNEYDICLMPRWDLDLVFGTMLGYLSGAHERIAFSENVWFQKMKLCGGFDKFLTLPLIEPPYIEHEAERDFFMLEAIGVPVKKRNMEMWLSDDDRKKARQLVGNFSKGRKLFAVMTGGSEPRKIYPKEMFADALAGIATNDVAFVFVGAKNDGSDADYIAARLPKGAALNLCGKTTLRESAAVLESAALYIGGDTGMKHIAAALNKPVIEINREGREKRAGICSSARRFAPWRTPFVLVQPDRQIGECADASNCLAKEAHCIKTIAPEKIVEAYRRLKRGESDRIVGNDNAEIDIAALIAPNARCVIELGIKNGIAAKKFRAINPDCRYIGVGANELALSLAAADMTKTLPASFASLDPAADELETADCIVCHGNYLQGLVAEDAAKKIRALAEKLSEHGQFIIVTENPGYVRSTIAMLRGRPLPNGTAPTLFEMISFLESAGLAIDKIVSNHLPADDEYKELAETKQLLACFDKLNGIEKIAPMQDIWAKSYIIHAAKNMPPKMRIQGMLGEAKITARVRVIEPNIFAARMPGIVHEERSLEAALDGSDEYPHRVLIRQRIHSESLDNALRDFGVIMGQGYLFVGEIDDHPMIWQKDYEKTDYIDFAGCHAVQVSTEPLADYIRQYNPNVFIFPNCLMELPEARDYEKERQKSTTLFFAALNRKNDWLPIMSALNECLKKNPDVLVKVLFDREFFDALKTKNKIFMGQGYARGFVPYEEYCRQLHTADINLLPLTDTEINRMKSDLKFIESAGHGVAVLASPTVYSATVKDGETGFIYKDAREFSEKLQLLLNDAPLRQRVAAAAYDYVKRNRLLSQHYEKRINVYRELIGNLPALTRDAKKRIAAIEARLRKK